MALIASEEPMPPPTPTPTLTKLNKPPPRKKNEPKVQEFERKLCNKCFGGVWNCIPVTSDHQKGKGLDKQRQSPPVLVLHRQI